MSDLEPITREEAAWINEGELTPITRKEQYIKHLYDETQVVPEKPLTREEWFINKAGEELHDVTIEQLNVSENGTYSETGKAYSPVNVAVPLGTKSITANGTYNASDDSLKGYSSVSVDVPLPDNAYLLKDISGTPCDIATFTDGAGLPMPTLKVAIEPQQDLHGYDSPWVGGSKKNKMPSGEAKSITQGGITISCDGNGVYTINGTASDAVAIPFACEEFTIPSFENATIYFFNTSLSLQFWFYYDDTRIETWDLNSGLNKKSSYSLMKGQVCNKYYVRASGGRTFNNAKLSPMICDNANETTYEPYSNICPISGWDEVDITVADDDTDPTASNVYTIDLDGTRYGGTLDVVNGTLTVTDAQIASYAGETLPGEWISDRDVYVAGTTPTTGAQVVYKLATPSTYQLSPTAIKTLLGTNNIFADTGDILSGEYWSKNPLTVTRAMLNTLLDAGEIAEITPEEPEENDER